MNPVQSELEVLKLHPKRMSILRENQGENLLNYIISSPRTSSDFQLTTRCWFPLCFPHELLMSFGLVLYKLTTYLRDLGTYLRYLTKYSRN